MTPSARKILETQSPAGAPQENVSSVPQPLLILHEGPGSKILLSDERHNKKQPCALIQTINEVLQIVDMMW